MTFPRARLTVAALLFAGWLGYLLLLVVLTRHTIVLSRPQFLVADLWVLAEVTGDEGKPNPKVKVLDLFWFKSPAMLKLKDQTIAIGNLPDAGPQGYVGPGKYILPVKKIEMANIPMYIVPPVPVSPGYVEAFDNIDLFSAGTDPKRTARLAVEMLGLDPDVARQRVDVVKDGGFMTLARNVPHERAMAFVFAAREVGEKGAPELRRVPNDVRIYPWTPETKEQIEEMVAAQ